MRKNKTKTVVASEDKWEAAIDKSYNDNVNHPAHYKRGKVECIDAVDAITTGMTGTYAHYTATILTYIWRWYFKNGVEDLKKARWYLNRLINKLDPTDKGT